MVKTVPDEAQVGRFHHARNGCNRIAEGDYQMKTDKQRIEELERRVKELEARPPVWMPVPYYVPQPYPVYPIYPASVPNPWYVPVPWTPTVPEGPRWISTAGTATAVTAQ